MKKLIFILYLVCFDANAKPLFSNHQQNDSVKKECTIDDGGKITVTYSSQKNITLTTTETRTAKFDKKSFARAISKISELALLTKKEAIDSGIDGSTDFSKVYVESGNYYLNCYEDITPSESSYCETIESMMTIVCQGSSIQY